MVRSMDLSLRVCAMLPEQRNMGVVIVELCDMSAQQSPPKGEEVVPRAEVRDSAGRVLND